MSEPHHELRAERLTLAAGPQESRISLVHDLSLRVRSGECLGIVGESGSGKSLTGLAMIGLLPAGVDISAGDVTFDGSSVAKFAPGELRRFRGREVSMVFQDPSSALNPTRTVRKQILDVVRTHLQLGKRDALQRVHEALRDVGFPDPANRSDVYPFQLSGGLKQRVCIAMALVCRPKFVIADEPTTNLDVSVQAGILRLVRSRIESDGFGCIFVSHDLGVISAVADRVAVMYSGEIVESGTVADVVGNPQHPYTRGLMAAAPTMQSSRDRPLRPYSVRRPQQSISRPATTLVHCGDVQRDHLVRVPA